MLQINLRIQHTRVFDSEMDALRMECFQGRYDSGTSRDEFDSRRWYVVVYLDNELAAFDRLTPVPNAVFEAWTQGAAEFPLGKTFWIWEDAS